SRPQDYKVSLSWPAGANPSRLPTPGRVLVALLAFHPARPLLGVLLLPERCPGLQVIHDEVAGIEGRLPVCAGHTDEDDRLARLQRTDAVQHLDLEQRPTLLGFDDDLGQGLLGHPRVMLEKHPGHVTAIVEIPHIADETDHRPHADIGRMHGIELVARVERLRLYPHAHAQPPVTGGKNATSS